MQELSLKVQMEKNYVNRNAKQARELKDSNEKIHALERTLQVRITSPTHLCSILATSRVLQQSQPSCFAQYRKHVYHLCCVFAWSESLSDRDGNRRIYTDDESLMVTKLQTWCVQLVRITYLNHTVI